MLFLQREGNKCSLCKRRGANVRQMDDNMYYFYKQMVETSVIFTNGGERVIFTNGREQLLLCSNRGEQVLYSQQKETSVTFTNGREQMLFLQT